MTVPSAYPLAYIVQENRKRDKNKQGKNKKQRPWARNEQKPSKTKKIEAVSANLVVIVYVLRGRSVKLSAKMYYKKHECVNTSI
jgi:hypothetical protein